TAAAGHAGRIVRGAEQARLDADVVERLALVPDVIARRHDVDAPLEQLIADLPRDAESRGRVLGVRDDEIDLVMLHDRGQSVPHEIASGPPHDVADEEELHEMAIGTSRPRRSTTFGSDTRSSPPVIVALARAVSHARPRWTTRANRP